MKLIDILNGISKGDIIAGYTFRINYGGYSFIIKYLYYCFKIINVKSSYNSCIFKDGDYFDQFILGALNYKVEYYDGGDDNE